MKNQGGEDDWMRVDSTHAQLGPPEISAWGGGPHETPAKWRLFLFVSSEGVVCILC